MSQSATSRYGLRVAPPGLALVQELLNTRSIYGYAPDLLDSLGDAQQWSDSTLLDRQHVRGGAVSRIGLESADLDVLRDLRAALVDLLQVQGGIGAPHPSRDKIPEFPATLIPDDHGVVGLAPAGSGAQWLASAVWIEVLLAQQAGTWPRLKLCRNEKCLSAFYDGSKNNSGVWHDVRTCGNAANLRASRARRRAAD